MTDRPPHPDPLWPDPGLAAIERRLERRDPVTSSPDLRHRVLMAVDDALAAPRPPAREEDDTRIPGWAWAAAAVLGVAMTTPIVAGFEALRTAEPPTLGARLRAAGLDDERLLAALAAPPRHDEDGPSAPHVPPVPSCPESRAFELRRLLEEML
jgi:hypothetical protein